MKELTIIYDELYEAITGIIDTRNALEAGLNISNDTQSEQAHSLTRLAIVALNRIEAKLDDVCGKIAATDKKLILTTAAPQNEIMTMGLPEDIEADCCLRVVGDSMTNVRICDGDIVFVKAQPTVKNGEIAAVLVDNETMLKRVFYPEGRLVLKAENAAFAPLAYIGEEVNEVQIIGKAVAAQIRL